jgi:hypothetical protein
MDLLRMNLSELQKRTVAALIRIDVDPRSVASRVLERADMDVKKMEDTATKTSLTPGPSRRC